MATLTALRSNHGRFDAYGLLASPLYSGEHLLIALKHDAGHDYTSSRSFIAGWTATEVTFDDTTDVQGTDRVPGHPSVVGLWLATYSESAPVATYADPSGLGALTLSDYTVTEAAGDAAYMGRRGFVAPPWDGHSRPYPYERPYP